MAVVGTDGRQQVLRDLQAAPALPVVSETQPPLGYSPPVMPAPEAAPFGETSATPTEPLPED